MGKNARWYVDYAHADAAIAKKLIVSKARQKKRHALTAAAQDEFKSGFAKTLRAWVKAGGDPNALDENGNLALCVAAFRAEPTLITPLLKAGADPTRRDGHGFSPLRLAAQSWEQRATEALLKAGALPDAADGDGVTPLVAACTAANPPGTVIPRLLDAGADPTQPGPDGEPLVFHVARRPLNRMAQDQRVWTGKAIEAFVAGGGAVDAPASDGRTLLHQVADELRRVRVPFWQSSGLYRGEEALFTIFCGELTAEVGGRRRSLKPDHARRVVKEGCPEHRHFVNAEQVALGLMKLGADPNAAGPGERPVHAIFEVGVPKLVRAAMKAGADPTLLREDGAGCVLLGARSVHLEPVKQALKAGADPNACAADGITALHEAAARGDAKLIRRLRKAGADGSRVAAADVGDVKAGETPLAVAERMGWEDAVKVLR